VKSVSIIAAHSRNEVSARADLEIAVILSSFRASARYFVVLFLLLSHI